MGTLRRGGQVPLSLIGALMGGGGWEPARGWWIEGDIGPSRAEYPKKRHQEQVVSFPFLFLKTPDVTFVNQKPLARNNAELGVLRGIAGGLQIFALQPLWVISGQRLGSHMCPLPHELGLRMRPARPDLIGIFVINQATSNALKVPKREIFDGVFFA